MPQNGEVNGLAIYKNLCCGIELVVRDGERFPDCFNHRKLTTVWKILNIELNNG